MVENAAMATLPSLTDTRVSALYRYPVKGLTGERLPRVEVEPGATFPLDRAFALENGPSGFDPSAPRWEPKIKFLCLMRNERLAALAARYDERSGILTVSRDGDTLVAGALDEESGRGEIERFFQDFMGREARGPVRVLSAPGHSFSDVSKKVVSIINLDTVADLGRATGRDVHPLRFRGNLYVSGLAPWSEFDLVGQVIEIAAARLSVLAPIERCAATEVNPETAERDMDVPARLMRLRDDADCGIYAEVIAAGTIAEGDAIRLVS